MRVDRLFGLGWLSVAQTPKSIGRKGKEKAEKRRQRVRKSNALSIEAGSPRTTLLSHSATLTGIHIQRTIGLWSIQQSQDSRTRTAQRPSR